MNITKGTRLYSLTDFNTAGFPRELKVSKVVGSNLITKSEIVQTSEIGIRWTTDWHTALLAFNGTPTIGGKS